MTQEERQLLFKDLSARLPYGCMLRVEGDWFDDEEREPYDCKLTPYSFMDLVVNHDCDVKPYLRPMSSMTEEEKEELKQEHVKDEKLYAECLTKAANGDNSMRGKVIPHFAADWCNKNYFNYRLPPHLFIEASKDTYKAE